MITSDSWSGCAVDYDLEAEFYPLYTCNYRCTYCFFPPETLGQKLRVHASPQEWREAFDRNGLRWLLHLTGGEPSIYPEFAELCSSLTERHFLSLNSNLTHKSILEFADRVDPSKVSFVNAGLHPDERERRQGMKTFVQHASRLNARGFPLIVSVVATPDALARFDEISAELRADGLCPVPKLMRGMYRGKRFPRSYTDEEKRIFRHHSRLAREAYGPLIAARPETPTINVFDDDQYLDGVPKFKGVDCRAGKDFVKIDVDGEVYRCANDVRLGNLLQNTFVRRQRAEPCASHHCYYVCKKYSKPMQQESIQQPVPSRIAIAKALSAASVV